MASAVKPPECDHLRLITAPYDFASEQAELIRVNEQLSSLDRHISELNTLRSTLHHRSSKLHNLLSPIHAFPIEVLSYIFQLVANPENDRFCSGDCYRECPGQAFVLSSVSSHFRHVAFGTPELWDRIPLHIAEDNVIDNLSSLLQHCIACAPNVSLCISERCSLEDYTITKMRSVIKTLITPETTRKVKTFHFLGSMYASTCIPEISATPFPIIETLSIKCGRGTQYLCELDFGEMNNLTRLNINGDWLDFPISVPPSLQYLDISTVSQKVFMSLLYQCPNLVECSADTGKELDGPPFTKPLILKHLKRLDTGTMNALTMSSSLQHLQLPSLESLEIYYFTERPTLDIVPFCCNVSATLTSLTIATRSEVLEYGDLYQLCRFTFPKLRDLRFTSVYVEPLMSVIHSLSPLDNESDNSRPLNLPALESITLFWLWADSDLCVFLDSLKNWWSDETLHLHLRTPIPKSGEKYWTPALEEEFRLIKGSLQIEIFWGNNKI